MANDDERCPSYVDHFSLYCSQSAHVLSGLKMDSAPANVKDQSGRIISSRALAIGAWPLPWYDLNLCLRHTAILKAPRENNVHMISGKKVVSPL